MTLNLSNLPFLSDLHAPGMYAVVTPSGDVDLESVGTTAYSARASHSAKGKLRWATSEAAGARLVKFHPIGIVSQSLPAPDKKDSVQIYDVQPDMVVAGTCLSQSTLDNGKPVSVGLATLFPDGTAEPSLRIPRKDYSLEEIRRIAMAMLQFCEDTEEGIQRVKALHANAGSKQPE